MRRLVLVAVVAGRAAAEPRPLAITHEPPPRHLRMRPRAAAVAKPARLAAPKTVPTAPDASGDVTYLRDVREPVSVRFNLGYSVDGVALTGQPTLGGRQPNLGPGSDFSSLHAYGFGEGNVSTRGVGLASVSTYLAAQFQLTRRDVAFDPTTSPPSTVVTAPPIGNWFDRSGVEPRAAWAEAKDFVPGHRLAPLRFRGGELYVYGPWVLHMYGGLVAWDGKLVSGTVYGGSRVPDYTLRQVTAADRAGIGGASLRVDLRDLARPIPFTIAGEVLGFTAAGATQPSNHSRVQIDWRPWGDFALIGDARADEQRLVNEHVQLRSRYHQVTNFVFDFAHRHSADWRWDPSVPDPDPLAAKRYLDLGPVLPQLVASVRAGTLIAENIDVYVRAAAASDVTSEVTQKSTYSASYVEAGGALEVRVRRTIAVGASGLTRQTQRSDSVASEIIDHPGIADPLPPNASPALGERGFSELGTSVRMSLGARKFSLLLEIYGRRTHYALDYCVPTAAIPDCRAGDVTGLATSDLRGGGRVTLDAWIGKRLRLFASYELSSALAFAPEITGYKSLRLIMEGIY